MSTDAERIVRDFCATWERLDIDELLGFFTPDAVYHNMPMPPVQGKAAIKAVFQQFVAPSTWIEWDTLNIADAGNVVLTERIDRYEMAGKRVELPVAGVFEVEGGKIAAWRDYFDMADWTRQTTGG